MKENSAAFKNTYACKIYEKCLTYILAMTHTLPQICREPQDLGVENIVPLGM